MPVAWVTGVLLAAGAGRRAGAPKALRRFPDGQPWLARAVQVLLAGGCAEVVVVLGCGAAEARRLLPAGPAVVTVLNEDWAEGMGSSLRAGLAAVPAGRGAVLVHLVDLPDVGAEVVRRVLGAAPIGAEVLVRAAYGGRPGHPVLVGRQHLSALAASLGGDRGGRAYLEQSGVQTVPCDDLATGEDVDGPRGPGRSS